MRFKLFSSHKEAAEFVVAFVFFGLLLIFVGGAIFLFNSFIVPLASPGYYAWHDAVAGSDRTVYPISCSNQPAEGLADCHDAVALGRIAYKIDSASQTVVSWWPDNVFPIVYNKLEGCAVADKNDWSCKSNPNSSTKLGFSDGKYFNSDIYAVNAIFVSANQWESVKPKHKR